MNRWLIGFTAVVCLLAGLTAGILLIVLQGPETTVRFKEPIQDLGWLCANSTVTQKNEMVVNGRAYLNIAATIRDLKTGIVYYPLSESYTLAVDSRGAPITITDIFMWKVPELPPSEYERTWAAATYRNVEPVTSITTFSVIACTADGVPLPTPAVIPTPTPES